MKLKLSILFIVLFSFFIAFGNTQNINNQLSDAVNDDLNMNITFHQFDSCQDIESMIKNYIEKFKDQNMRWWYTRWGAIDDLEAQESVSMSDAAKENAWSNDASNEYSTTNVQKVGVDEPEIIKTDWDYIYYYNQKEQKIYIIKSPLDMVGSTVDIDNVEIVTIINIPDRFWGINMFIQEDKLIVIWSRNIDINPISYGYVQRNDRTSVAIYDVSNIHNINLVKFTDIDGYYSDARMIWDKLYLITDMYINRWDILQSKDTQINWDSIIPKAIDILDTTSKVIEPDCSDISYIMPSDDTVEHLSINPSFTVISVFEVDEVKKDPKLNVLFWQDGQIHMTKDSLYISQAIWFPHRWACGFGARCIMPWFDEWQQTLIHKFNIDGLDINYQASNMVEWSLLSQYSMDEDEKWNFRILTSKNWSDWTNFYTFDDKLSLEWKITWIEAWEQFKASRYIGDKLYLVTFEQVDPLFVIDIENIQNPKIIWELKIPWYSTYLHPVWNLVNWVQYLMWLWYDTKESNRGWTENAWVKLDLYKVDYNIVDSNGNIKVEQIHTKTFWSVWSYSEVIDNPRLFVMDSDNTVTLPMVLQERLKNWETCTITKDTNWVEIKSDCYPIIKQKTTFAWLKSIKLDFQKWISEKFSVNYLDIYQKLYGSNSEYYDIDSRQINGSNMRVWFVGKSLYMLNNDFWHFVFTNNNNYKYLYFNNDITNNTSNNSQAKQLSSQVVTDKINMAEEKLYTIMWIDETDPELEEAISLLYKYNITKFDNVDSFMPQKAIRRDEAAKMFVSFYEELLENWKVEKNTGSCSFLDLNNSRPDLPNLIQKSCEYWLFKWYKWNFMPTDSITNGQAVVVLMRLLQWAQDEENVGHYAQNYMKLAEDYELLDGLNIDSEKYWDLPATRKSIAKLLYRAR